MPYKDIEKQREYSRRYSKETYYWLKEHHICKRCRMADAMVDRVYCPECSEKCSKENELYYQKNKKEIISNRYNARLDKIDKGICYICGKPASEKRKGLCDYHRSLENRKQRERNHRKYGTRSREDCKALGICIRCCKEQAMPHHSYCQKCFESTKNNFKAAMAKGQMVAKENGWNNN